METATKYNRTQLSIERDFAEHVLHRDRFAHFLRWSYVMRKMGAPHKFSILDVGCGNAELLKTLYRNSKTPAFYHGVDIRGKTIQANKQYWADKAAVTAAFTTMDIVLDRLPPSNPDGQAWDFVTCFEVCEHVGKKNVPTLLDNLAEAGKYGTVLVSTPCYDPCVGAAQNHYVDGVVAELTHAEMAELVGARFDVVAKFGTFASKKDILPVMTEQERGLYAELGKYYDPNVLAVIFAPKYPAVSRNVCWELKAK